MSQSENQEGKPPNPLLVVTANIAPLFSIASSAMLLSGFAITLAAKTYVFTGIQSDGSPVADVLRINAEDLLFFFAMASAFLVLEAIKTQARPLTAVLAAAVLAFSIVNACYLVIAGAQVDFATFITGVERFHDAWGIFKNWMSRQSALGASLLLAVPAAVYGLRLLGQSVTVPQGPFAAHIKLSIALAGSGAAVSLLSPAIENYSVRQIANNAVVSMVVSWKEYASRPERALSNSFQSFSPRDIITPASMERVKGGRRPNVVMVILESTRYDYVEMPDGAPGSPYRPKTPNLKRLAWEGTWASGARAMVPHTTKSIYSIFCARAPILHLSTFESSLLFDSQCLPEILTKAGYKTAFLQTAIGAFEFRPRLVETLGFQDFAAWENIGRQPLGYLASDDRSLGQAFINKLDAYGGGKEPFFITLLTSAPHHPYQIPDRLLSGGETHRSLSAEERFARLIADEDALLGDVLAELNKRGLRENTIVVALGDHGEGFGAKGVKQHDNNFFEEGLLVPLIFAGHGVPRKRIEGNVSLVDVTPTLLALLGFEYILDERHPLNGRNIYAPQILQVPRYFFCYYESTCAGFVLGEEKVVKLLNQRRQVYFDLAVDPNELAPKKLSPTLAGMLPDLDAHYQSRRFAPSQPELIYKSRLKLESGWDCPKRDFCNHPNSPPNYFHQNSGIFR